MIGIDGEIRTIGDL